MGIGGWSGVVGACWLVVSCGPGLVVAKVMTAEPGEGERTPRGWERLRARAVRSDSRRRPRVPACTATHPDRVAAVDGRRRTGPAR
jgi:hypothetical protein